MVIAAFAALALIGSSFSLAHAAGDPKIDVSVHGGAVVVVLGTNYPPSASVDVTVTAGEQMKQITSQSDASGRFVANTFLPPNFSGQVDAAATSGEVSQTGTANATGSASSIPVADPTETEQTGGTEPTSTEPAGEDPGTVTEEGSQVPASGGTWLSGASGDGVDDGSFGTWRGEPVTIAGTWNDLEEDLSVQIEQWSVSSGGNYGTKWEGAVDNAVGAFVSGGSWSQAAAGAYDDNWKKAAANIAGGRKSAKGTTYLRLAHEMNGDWYPWKVAPGDAENFKTAFKRWTAIIKAELPNAQIVFSPNSGTSGGMAAIPDIWPGDDVVDVIGIDMYDADPDFMDQATWDSNLMKESNGSPEGLGAWLAFAKQHGKPLAFPEWGLKEPNDAANQDNPFYIQKMNEFFKANAGSGPGQVLYEIYYNIDTFAGASIFPNGGSNPKAAEEYARLSWGQ